MVKKILFLDDMKVRHDSFRLRFPNENITFVETAKEAIAILEKDLQWDVICLDHDLGGRIFVDSEDENTGYQVAKFLSGKKMTCNIIVHSCNPVGAKRMLDLLPNAYYAPMFWLNAVVEEMI